MRTQYPGKFALFILLGLVVCGGCLDRTRTILPDIDRYPQQASWYEPQQTAVPAEDQSERSHRRQSFRSRYFRPWHAEKPLHPRNLFFWPLQPNRKQQFFGANTRPHPPQWLAALQEKASPESLPSLSQPAITLTNTDLRAMPTQEPAFHDFRKPGEGYPFDAFQHSALWAGTPVHIVHATRSRDWLLVETDWVFGWVPNRDIGLVDTDFMAAFQSRDLAALIRDRVAVIDRQGVFRFTGHIGGLLPLDTRRGNRAEVLVPAPDANRQARLRTAWLEPGSWTPFPMPATGSNFARVADELLGQTYGWGGLYEYRDCSALTRDYFTPFALWLPRNSSQQAKLERRILLGHLRAEEKVLRIQQQGIPFVTLLWMPGHVMIYVGTVDNRPLVLHAMWGLKTRSPFRGEGRFVIGRSVITSLTPGRGLPHLVPPGSDLLDRVQGMSILLEP